MASATIRFDATLRMVDGQAILKLPEGASKRLPSRSQVAVHGTINGHTFQTVLEPDGDFGHWMRVDGGLQRATGLSSGDPTTVQVEPTKEWPEPGVPRDFEKSSFGCLSEHPRPLDGDHAHGAMGVGSLGERDQES